MTVSHLSIAFPPKPKSPKFKDLEGQILQDYLICSFMGISMLTSPRDYQWLCMCNQCGTWRLLPARILLSPKLNVCKCSKRAWGRHGMTGTKAYITWVSMRSRCENPKNIGYKDYGGRGIKVCKRWQRFENFYLDMGEPPRGHSLDRINNDGDYKRSNCRWATPKEQGENTRHVRWITLNGQTKRLQDWCKQLKRNPKAVGVRLAIGWSEERALMTPVRFRSPRGIRQIHKSACVS